MISNLSTDSNQGISDGATPMIKRATAQASALAHQGIDSLTGASRQLRDRAQHASEDTVSYIKDKPYTAVLIAAAGGAALMALAGLLSRSRYRD